MQMCQTLAGEMVVEVVTDKYGCPGEYRVTPRMELGHLTLHKIDLS